MGLEGIKKRSNAAAKTFSMFVGDIRFEPLTLPINRDALNLPVITGMS